MCDLCTVRTHIHPPACSFIQTPRLSSTAHCLRERETRAGSLNEARERSFPIKRIKGCKSLYNEMGRQSRPRSHSSLVPELPKGSN